MEPLTKSQIAALRQADTVYGVMSEDQHLLRAVKRRTNAELERDPFGVDVTIDIPIDGSIHCYGSNGGTVFSEKVVSCFDSQREATVSGSAGAVTATPARTLARPDTSATLSLSK